MRDPIPRALRLHHMIWIVQWATTMEERAIRLYSRVQADPRYAEAERVLALAEQAEGSRTQHIRRLLHQWCLADPPGPQAGAGPAPSIAATCGRRRSGKSNPGSRAPCSGSRWAAGPAPTAQRSTTARPALRSQKYARGPASAPRGGA